MASTALVAQARAVEDRLKTDPIWFFETVLGCDPWDVPRRIVEALNWPRARVAVKACHASAKSWTAGRLVLWWVLGGGIAITTAPTFTQVKEVLWGEIRSAYAQAAYPLGGTLLQTEYRIGPDAYALGLSTNEGVRFQGWHGKVLIVLDEAPGVRPDIWTAIDGIRAGGDVRVLALGNPFVTSGPFVDAFKKNRTGWTTFTIDAFATPNLRSLFPPDDDPTELDDEAAMAPLLALPDEQLDENVRPYLTTRRWVLEQYYDLGTLSPLWQSKVRGRFPQQSDDALLSLAWLDAAKTRTIEPKADDAWEAGVDVAGPGEDETSVAVRRGPTLVHQNHWRHPDPRGEVLADLAPFREQLQSVKVDSIGQGYYFARHLEDNGYSGRVVDVNVGLPAAHPEKYANAKAEYYWGLRQRAQAGDMAGLTDELTISQLAGLLYEHNARGQVVIESKDDARKRGVKSPDRAEALMLCFADIGTLPFGWMR